MRRALITGTSSGIGLAAAEAFLHQGYRVIGLSRPKHLGGRGARALGDRYRHCELDVVDRSALSRFVDELEPLDALVLNAGVCKAAKLGAPAADAVWDEVLATNLTAPFRMLSRATSRLAPGASVVAVSSGLGRRGRADYAAYCASKHGLLGLVKAAALELAPSGVRVNAVCPGWVSTPMARADLARATEGPGEARRAAVAAIPLGRFVEPSEVAALMLFLCSPEAAAITGQAYDVSAGEVIG